MSDFLSFRKMITPVVIQVLFWIGVLICLVVGAGMIGGGDALPYSGLVSPKIMGFLVIIGGPLIVRIYCELLIVLFRIHESLRVIEQNSTK